MLSPPFGIESPVLSRRGPGNRTLTSMTIRVRFQALKVKFNVNRELVRDDFELSPYQFCLRNKYISIIEIAVILE